jgi:hypothetical protein
LIARTQQLTLDVFSAQQQLQGMFKCSIIMNSGSPSALQDSSERNIIHVGGEGSTYWGPSSYFYGYSYPCRLRAMGSKLVGMFLLKWEILINRYYHSNHLLSPSLPLWDKPHLKKLDLKMNTKPNNGAISRDMWLCHPQVSIMWSGCMHGIWAGWASYGKLVGDGLWSADVHLAPDSGLNIEWLLGCFGWYGNLAIKFSAWNQTLELTDLVLKATAKGHIPRG